MEIPDTIDLSAVTPSPRDRRRLARGVKFGVLGAVLFIISLILVMILFEIAEPFVKTGTEYVVESRVVRWGKDVLASSGILTA